jgi:hypothetical protein
MEITTHLHGISQQELDSLCTHVEEKVSSSARLSGARLVESGRHDRRPRARRSRS